MGFALFHLSITSISAKVCILSRSNPQDQSKPVLHINLAGEHTNCCRMAGCPGPMAWVGAAVRQIVVQGVFAVFVHMSWPVSSVCRG